MNTQLVISASNEVQYEEAQTTFKDNLDFLTEFEGRFELELLFAIRIASTS